jgi:hypothetical protein
MAQCAVPARTLDVSRKICAFPYRLFDSSSMAWKMLKGPCRCKNSCRETQFCEFGYSDTGICASASVFGVSRARVRQRGSVLCPDVDSEEGLLERDMFTQSQIYRTLRVGFLPTIISEDAATNLRERSIRRAKSILVGYSIRCC